MAEVLGVASSVSGLMTIADSIVRKGFKFIKDVKDAEKSVEKLVEEVNNLSGVLHSLNNVVERLEEDRHNVDPSTQIHYIESCYKTLMKIQGHFDEAVPATPMSKGAKLQWPLKKSHTQELLVEIDRHKATMNLAMTAREMTALLEILARQDGIQEGLQGIKLSLEADRAERRKVAISEERRKMLRHLGDIDARKWQDSNIRLRQPGTGVWFTDGTEFQSWLSTNQSKLWINGIPGAGKTILISSIIQEIEKRVECSHALTFFYCDYKDPQTHDPLALLGALARQLILQDERCFGQLAEFTQDHTMNDGSVRGHTPEELCDLIMKLSKHFKTTMIVVDGLDEITNNRADVTRLLRHLNTESGQIKTLFASRPEVDIGYELEEFIQVSIAAMSSDLRLYVASEIDTRTRERKLRIRDPNLKDHIMKTLVDGADGMFRWVACQMDYLCECSNDRDRREALRKLPPDLPSSYERILERSNRSSKENQDLVKKTLHWIVYAYHADRPFGTDELLQALGIRDGEKCFDQSSMPTEEEVLHWCSSLVRKNATTARLELAHFTVKEFLEAIDPVRKPFFQQYRLSGDHTILAKACLSFIRCQVFDDLALPSIVYDDDDDESERSENFWSFINDYGFMRYSCVNWSYHVHDANWDDIEKDVLDIFSSEKTFKFWIWVWLWYQRDDVGPSGDFGKPELPTALHWAAVFALDKLCAKFIQGGMDVSQQSCMGTPLYCAMLSRYAIYDCSEAREMDGFLEIERDRSWKRSSREKVVRRIVEAGAHLDVAVDPENQRRATIIALDLEGYNDNPFIVSTLINAGAKLSAEDFAILYETSDSIDDDPEFKFKDMSLDSTLCGITPSSLIQAVAKDNGKCLMPATDLHFFSFLLSIISRGVPLEHFQPFFKINFKEFFPETNGSELDDIICDQTMDQHSRLVIVLSKAIRNSSPTTDHAISSLQESLDTAVAYSQSSIVSLLLQHNEDLDASHQHVDFREEGWTLLHVQAEYFGYEEKEDDILIIRSLILHGANVMYPNKKGVTSIEIAAANCNLDAFQLFWDSAIRSKVLEASPNIIEKILSCAISSSNQPVMKFLVRELVESSIMSNNFLLEFAVRQETSTFLELIIRHYEFNDDSVDGRIVEEQDDEDDGEDEEGQDREDQDREDQGMISQSELEDAEMTARDVQAFYLAAKPDGSLANFTYLVEQDVYVSHQYDNGNTVLHILASNHDEKSFKKLQILLELEPAVDILNDANLTPLALAVRSKNVRGMELLLDAEASLDVTFPENQTILHMACCLGNKAAVESLLKHDCQTWQQNSQGLTPKDVALSCGYFDIAAIIENPMDADPSLDERQTSIVSEEKGPEVSISSFAHTEDHGNLALRIAREDSIPAT